LTYEILAAIKGIYPEKFSAFASLNAFLANFEALPKIKEYMASPRFKKAFFNPIFAAWTGI
jgi:hypothetical protein